MSVPIALPTAVAYGVADFAGGLAARRAPVLVVTAVVQAGRAGRLLPVVVPGGRASVGCGAAWSAALAGIAGAAGLLLYLRALAVGPMGVVAPLSAVVGAGLPLAVGAAGRGAPGSGGRCSRWSSRWWPSCWRRRAPGRTRPRHGPLLGLAAGVGFGLFFVGLDATPPDSGLWPLLAGRVVTVTLLGRAAACAAPPLGGPARTRLMVVCGVCDTAANVRFLLATRLGDLGVSAVVVSLYPVVVVLLARVVLGERLTRCSSPSAGLAAGGERAARRGAA